MSMPSCSLYQQVMGERFALLPMALRQFHALQGAHVLGGWAEVGAPESFLAKVLARLLGTPLEARRGPIRFELRAGAGSEVWTRRFPARTMQSQLTLGAGCIIERLGAARLSFVLDGDAETLEMRLVTLHFLGVRCPRWLMPHVVAQETASPGRLHFRVRASLPLVGVITRYEGHLELPEGGVA